MTALDRRPSENAMSIPLRINLLAVSFMLIASGLVLYFGSN